MSNNSAIIRICVSGLFTLVLLLYSSFSFLLGSETVTASAENIFLASNNKEDEILSEEETSSEETKVEEKKNTETEETSSAYIETAATGNVLGKIVDKFITPYTANTSYNNIYLKNSTGLDINLESLYKAKLGYTIQKNDEPQVLIVHTHATESFIFHGEDYYTDTDSSRSTDLNKNMTAVGEIVANKLNEGGIKTLHDKTLHDYPSYNESYSRSAKTIKGYLEKYPSIKIVIDLHRDAIASDTDKIKVTTEIEGKKAAQVMLVMGSQSGNVTNFPNWQENLKLAVKLQEKMESMYPSLARSINLVSRTYNENLTTGSLLLEMGTDANSFSEVCYSAELVGNALVKLLG